MARKSKAAENVLTEVRVRLVPGMPLFSEKPLDNPRDVVEVLSCELATYDREYFVIANYNKKMHPINYSVISIGQLDYGVVSIPNVIKTAILSNASSMILFHNHPSGDPSPSPADIDVTKRLKLAADLMNVGIMDHIIVGANNVPDLTPPYFSMAESKIIDFNKSSCEKFINEYFEKGVVKRTRRR